MFQELTEVKRELTRMDKVTATSGTLRVKLALGLVLQFDAPFDVAFRVVQVVYGKSRATTNGGISWDLLAPTCSVLARTDAVLHDARTVRSPI